MSRMPDAITRAASPRSYSSAITVVSVRVAPRMLPPRMMAAPSSVNTRANAINMPEKSAGRGLCGCGLPDEADGGVTCADVVALLAHRYAFNGTGMTAVDSQG